MTEVKMGMSVHKGLWELVPDNVVDGFKSSIMRQYPDAEITDIHVACEDVDWFVPQMVGLIAKVTIKGGQP